MHDLGFKSARACPFFARFLSFSKTEIPNLLAYLIDGRRKHFDKDATYRISANSFRGKYSFFNLEIVENSNSYRKF